MKFKERLWNWLSDKRAENSAVGAIIAIFVSMIIGAALVEPLAYDISQAVAGNLTTFPTAITLANLVPVFFVMLLVALAIAEVVRRL